MLEKFVEDATGKRIRTCASLKGGISSEMLKFVLSSGESVVLRHIIDSQWLNEEPDLIEHEKQSLLIMKSMSVPTPHFLAAGPPKIEALLMSELPGSVDLEITQSLDAIKQLATTLHVIHQTPILDPFKWTYSSYVKLTNVSIPSWTTQHQAWTKAIQFVQNTPKFHPVFIHRDYHPTNILWEGNQLSGVVDWINACLGPALVDVAHCRMNLVMLYGLETADQFLGEYLHLSEETYTPYWDILGLLDFVDEDLDVYDGWTDSGYSFLNRTIMQQRADVYIQNLTAKLDAL
ncbi:phosphotransferase family protein [Paenisporosarcina sp. NPDC076898]|uniref:phosphotransferase family protein n=1 Tax=unclassified Paenisporosarcina TaxID=2642018 RepID=UPI003D04FFE1